MGFVRSVVFEIKDLTCNAQFNFCLLSICPEFPRGICDRSELAHSAPLDAVAQLSPCLSPAFAAGHLRSRSRVTNSRIKLSKIAVLANFRATKNSISVPTLILRLLHNRSLGHCRDKIEFNLKSQKLEEHNCLLEQRLAFCSGTSTVGV